MPPGRTGLLHDPDCPSAAAQSVAARVKIPSPCTPTSHTRVRIGRSGIFNFTLLRPRNAPTPPLTTPPRRRPGWAEAAERSGAAEAHPGRRSVHPRSCGECSGPRQRIDWLDSVKLKMAIRTRVACWESRSRRSVSNVLIDLTTLLQTC